MIAVAAMSIIWAAWPRVFDPQPLQLFQENFPTGSAITLTPWDPQEVWPLMAAALRSSPAVIAPFVSRPSETVPDRKAIGLAPASDAVQGVYKLLSANGKSDGSIVAMDLEHVPNVDRVRQGLEGANYLFDGQKVEITEGSMIMHAAEKAGTYIPHFCYHKKLSIAANCRMCLVDVEKAPKPMPACATPVTNGMIVRTKSDKALKAQQSVMEFLLINHPLDCPICDQGGECQLQDLAVGYGASASRYEEEKRVVFHKDVGPLISMEEMSRCIHCTRCVRFGQEVAGKMELGMIHRGEHSEITTVAGDTVDSHFADTVAAGHVQVTGPWVLGQVTDLAGPLDGSRVRDALAREDLDLCQQGLLLLRAAVPAVGLCRPHAHRRADVGAERHLADVGRRVLGRAFARAAQSPPPPLPRRKG